ncbi:sulfatase/phosphatase domain-containing protein [uncultured Metabacillus sp.]|uniref:sulfatase/phosphatase domain-containing protein n=1 Tax=uncultured Metabacillus sp. TaxID=2860135 RepID=UPI002619C67B|nr:sulfatase/phosphatase domain-containing protein [uncultured Metabacillus sp.]
MKRKGEIDHRPGHFIDFMATFVEITGVSYPATYKGHNILPMEGESLMPIFTGENTLQRTLCFEHEHHCGIRQGEWKLSKIREKDWELYNIKNDRTEMHNLKDEYPVLVNEMKKTWEEWAERTNVYPRKLLKIKS